MGIPLSNSGPNLIGPKTPMADIAMFGEITDYFQPQINTFSTLVAAYLVFFMHAGFCMVEVGCVRAKNAKNTVIMTLLDAAFAAIGWWATGFAFAFGDQTTNAVTSSNGFIGSRNFFMINLPHDQYYFWLFQYAFATTATTIVSGAVAERCRFEAYIFYGLFQSMWVYPVVVHWVWALSGWASAFLQYEDGAWVNSSLLFNVGVYDFAGSGTVHMVGGFSSFWAALALGPRIGRFDGEGKPVDMPGHNMSFFILGVFILWFGWYGFNPGSQLGVTGFVYDNVLAYGDGNNFGGFLNSGMGGNAVVTARAAVNTTLAAAWGLFGGFFYKMLLEFIQTRTLVWDVMAAGNGTLAGLAAITAGCHVVQPWGAAIIGTIAGMVYVTAAWFVLSILKVDDPVEAIAIHGFGGMWGVFAVALFAQNDYVTEVYGPNPATGLQRHYGWWMGDTAQLLASQTVWALVILGWVTANMAPFFFLFKAIGFLRVSAEMERAGLDQSHHGGSAYNMTDFTGAAPGVVKPAAPAGGVNKDLEREIADLKTQLQRLSEEMRGNGAPAAAKASV